MKILITCPPMLGMIDSFRPTFAEKDIGITTPKVTQTLTVEELKVLVPEHDGWIIGDDPATREVFETGKAGLLKAAVKWGIGIDNVDFDACKDLGIPITNTPNMFGAEVADVAVAYTIGLARQLFFIDRNIKTNIEAWPKPVGISLANKQVGLIGFGDIGRNVAKRLMACEMHVTAYDPNVQSDIGVEGITRADWPNGIEDMDFLIFTCALNSKTYHMLNAEILAKVKYGVYVVNVARGQIIDEEALIEALLSQKVQAAALDVFEVEPLLANSKLRTMPQCIFGSHNGSNTKEAVKCASYKAIEKLFKFLGIQINGIA